MTEFNYTIDHKGYDSGAQGMNFMNIKGEQFIYINPENLSYWDFDEFVKDIIKVSLIEFICSKTLTKYSDYELSNVECMTTEKEGKLTANKSLCDDGVFSMRFGGCKCEQMASRMLL